MKKAIAFICIVLGLTMASTLPARGIKGGLTWEMTSLAGKYAKFSSQYSFRGGAVWLDFNLTRKLSLGLEAGYHQLFENKARATYHIGNGQVFTAATYNSIYDIPLFANIRYTIFARGIIRPYVSCGVGAIYTNQEIVFADMVLREKTWGFGLAPTVGTYLTLGDRIPVGLNIFARYGISFNDYTYKTEKISPYQYFNIGVGLLFH